MLIEYTRTPSLIAVVVAQRIYKLRYFIRPEIFRCMRNENKRSMPAFRATSRNGNITDNTSIYDKRSILPGQRNIDFIGFGMTSFEACLFEF